MPPFAPEEGIIFIILSSKFVYHLLHEETPSLHSEAVFYANVFEKIV